ncbi:hypothetical protein [Ruegeria sp. EL01]|uniref:hypothetical protein n=1 Tax=Ruegeria sp. EL01 TaxID=2107578 RepID=UPI000EA7F521|nr:hypothetical protein [Ruegeria sp. EL01]
MRWFAGVFVSVSAAVTFFVVSTAIAQELVVELATVSSNENGTECIFKYRSKGVKQQMLKLNLKPPCNFAERTTDHAPNASSTTERDAIGDAMKVGAWRFGNGTLIIPIIGDPIPFEWRSSELFQLRKSQGLMCGASLQGVLVDAKGVRVSPKREHVGFFCKELGISAKEAWLLANPK